MPRGETACVPGQGPKLSTAFSIFSAVRRKRKHTCCILPLEMKRFSHAMLAALTVHVASLVWCQGPFQQQQQKPKGPWMDKSLSPDRRAGLVIAQMTLDEKISLLHGGGWRALFGGPDAPPTRSLGGSGFIPGIPRLGIPDLQMVDAAVGVGRGAVFGRYATPLPSTVAEAATWDLNIAREYGALIGRVYDPGNTKDVKAVGWLIGSDKAFVEPARFVARQVRAAGQAAYEYRFSYVAESMRKEWKGAPHATEIPFVFSTVEARYGDKLAAADRAAAEAAHAYGVAFAKTGDPNGGGRPVWPVYDASEDRLMNFTEQGPVAQPDPWKERLDLIEAVVSAGHAK